MFGSRNRKKRLLGREIISTIESLGLQSAYLSKIYVKSFEQTHPDVSVYDDIQLVLEIAGWKSAHSSLLFLNVDKSLMEDYLNLLDRKMIGRWGYDEMTIYVYKEMSIKMLKEGRSQTDPESDEPYIYMGTNLIEVSCNNLLDNDQIKIAKYMVKKYLDNLGLDKLVTAVDNFNNS
jgi:hypothetical protein